MSEWFDVPGFNGFLQATKDGSLRTKDRLCASKRENQPWQLRKGRVLSPSENNGYLEVALKIDGIRKKYLVHRLIATTFVSGHFEGATVDHIDGDRKNNRHSNLEWVTREENSRRQNAAGRGAPKGDKHPISVIKDDFIPEIFAMRKSGVPVVAIAKMANCSPSLIYQILLGNRRAWQTKDLA